MFSIRSLSVTASLSLALALIAPAASPARAGGGCRTASGSSVDQYCETFPGAGGSRVPAPGERTVGETLPASITSGALALGGGASLLALPAASVPHSRARPSGGVLVPIAAGGVAGHGASPASLGLPLILAMAGLAVLIALLAAERIRRARRSSG